jgi:hypothetical protein
MQLQNKEFKLMTDSQISPETMNEIITQYIVENHNIYEQDDAINDIDILKKLCQENPTITHYPSPARYWSKSSDDIVECSFTELPTTDIYDFIHFSPGFQDSSPTSKNEFAKIQTEYIVELYEKYNITKAISSLEKHTHMLRTDPIIYMYLLSDSAIWSFTQLYPNINNDVQKSFHCTFSALSSEHMYYVLSEKETEKIKYQSSLQAWA